MEEIVWRAHYYLMVRRACIDKIGEMEEKLTELSKEHELTIDLENDRVFGKP